MNNAGTAVIVCSRNPQSGTQNPIESLALICLSFTPCRANLRIEKIAGTEKTLELFTFGSTLTQFLVPGDSIWGHAAVPGVIAVGAIAANDPGNTAIQLYSSRGPSTILLPAPQ